MKNISKKIASGIILASLLLIVGGFCDGSIASAKNIKLDMPMMQDAYCGEEAQGIQQSAPVNNALMPCCIERHDNSGTIIPTVTQEKVKLSQILMTQQVICATQAVEQKIYPSSPSPPSEAENISSTVKIE